MLLLPGQIVSDIPITPEGQPEHSKLAVLDLSGFIREVQVVTCPSGGTATQADYFLNYYYDDSLKFAIWLDIDGNGTAPTGSDFTNATYQKEIDILSTDTATQVATKIREFLQADADFIAEEDSISQSGANLSILQDTLYNILPIAVHNANDSGSGSFTQSTTAQGVPATLDGKHFLISSQTRNLYVFFNMGLATLGSVPGGYVVKTVSLSGNETAGEICQMIAGVLNGDAGNTFEATCEGDQLHVSSTGKANITNASSGDCGYSLDIQFQGTASFDAFPSGNAGALSNSPGTIAPRV